jgi:hypothetical protein
VAKRYRVQYYRDRVATSPVAHPTVFHTREEAADLRDRLNAEGAWRRACVVEFEHNPQLPLPPTTKKRMNP